MNSFVKKSEATMKNGKVRKGYMQLEMTTKTGKKMIRYKKNKVEQSKKTKKVVKKDKSKAKKCVKECQEECDIEA